MTSRCHNGSKSTASLGIIKHQTTIQASTGPPTTNWPKSITRHLNSSNRNFPCPLSTITSNIDTCNIQAKHQERYQSNLETSKTTPGRSGSIDNDIRPIRKHQRQQPPHQSSIERGINAQAAGRTPPQAAQTLSEKKEIWNNLVCAIFGPWHKSLTNIF